MGSAVTRSYNRGTATYSPDNRYLAADHSRALQSLVIWEWELRGKWKPFDAAESAELCRIVKSGHGRGTWEARNTMYEGDVFAMQQKNLSTGGIRSIRFRPVDATELPEFVHWSDHAGGWMRNKELDLKFLTALRHGHRVEHIDLEYDVNFADNCLQNEFARHPFRPSNNIALLAWQMDWGTFQWRDKHADMAAWTDFGLHENNVIEEAWGRGDAHACFLWNAQPIELSFLSWTLLNLVTHWTAAAQIGHHVAKGANSVVASPTYEYYDGRWKPFTGRLDNQLAQCFNRKEARVVYSTRSKNYSADLESCLATELKSKTSVRLRRVDAKPWTPEPTQKQKGSAHPRCEGKDEKQKGSAHPRCEGKDEKKGPNPFNSPRYTDRWKNENADRFNEAFPPRRAGKSSYEEDIPKRRFSTSTKSKEWDNADYGTSKEVPRPSKLPEPTESSEERCKEIKTILMGNLKLPLEERKSFFKVLQRELHPDKSKEDYATKLFQYLMSNKGWFLLGPKTV